MLCAKKQWFMNFIAGENGHEHMPSHVTSVARQGETTEYWDGGVVA